MRSARVSDARERSSGSCAAPIVRFGAGRARRRPPSDAPHERPLAAARACCDPVLQAGRAQHDLARGERCRDRLSPRPSLGICATRSHGRRGGGDERAREDRRRAPASYARGSAAADDDEVSALLPFGALLEFVRRGSSSVRCVSGRTGLYACVDDGALPPVPRRSLPVRCAGRLGARHSHRRARRQKRSFTTLGRIIDAPLELGVRMRKTQQIATFI